MFYSFKIQNIFSKFPEFLNLQRIAYKFRGRGFIMAIPDHQIYFLDLVREEKYLMVKCFVLLLKLFLPFYCSRIVLLLY